MIGAIIQARMGSSRLPGKVLKTIDGIELLLHQIRRVKKSTKIKTIVVATTTDKLDDAIETFCEDNKLICFRGSQDDVLNRYYEAAKKFNITTIVRLTADCPLVHRKEIDKTIELFEHNNLDYAANTVPPETSTYPDGSDVEVFSYEVLKKANQEEKDIFFREHVTFHFWKNNNQNNYKIGQLISKNNWSKFRYTVDYVEDYEVVKKIFFKLKIQKMHGSTKDIIKILKDNPDIYKLNSKYYFGIGWEKSENKKNKN